MLSLSTLGSFLGAIVTTTVLMTILGVAWTLVLVTGALLIMTLLLALSQQDKVFQLCLVVPIFIASYWMNVVAEQSLYVHTNSYANYEILDLAKVQAKLLRINGSYSAVLYADKQGFPYIETIKKIIFDELKLRGQDILVLGAGGFTLTAAGTHSNHVSYVDIDADIKSIVQTGIGVVREKLIGKDARVFFNKNHHTYDAIISDAYSSLKIISSYLLTQEYFLQLRGHLKKNGVAVFNMIVDPRLRDKFSKRIDNTLRSVFTSCMQVPITFSTTLSNVLYVCFNNQRTIDHTIYRDNKHTANLDPFFR